MDSKSTTPVERKNVPPKKFRNPFAAPEDDEEPSCGMFGWRPTWLQLFRNMKMFMFCFVAMGIFHGTSSSYMSSVLPSIERRFGFSSTKIGTVRAMSDVSHIICALIVGHYGGHGHRPRWIAMGMFLLGLGMFLFASPEIFFPRNSIPLTPKNLSSSSSNNKSSNNNEELCSFSGKSPNSTVNSLSASCAKAGYDDNINPLIIFGLSEFLMGLGATTPMILALPFVDDNVSYRSTPTYFALSFAGRLLGPILGYGLGAVFNTIYFDFSHPHFPQSDPRWISAWYLGFIVCGIGVCLFAVTIGCFPATLPKKNIAVLMKQNQPVTTSAIMTHHSPPRQKKQPVHLKDLPINLKRLLTNSTYMIKLGSQLLEGLAIAGYMGFSQKFIQNQYPVTPAVASLAGGIPVVLAGGLGIAIGSILIRKLKFQPRHVSMMTAVSSLVASACYFSVIAMGCGTPQIIGLEVITTPPSSFKELSNECHIRNDCHCQSRQYNPVCDSLTGTSYVSPCIAGCVDEQRVNRTKHYLGCSCTANVTHLEAVNPVYKQVDAEQHYYVIPGLCVPDCNRLIQYILVMCLAKLLMGLPLAGILMIQFRIVDYDLKSLANAVTSFTMSALGFLPAPIIAGFIIDSTCRYWQIINACNQRGACLIYNVDDFRTKLHVSVGVCKLLAAALDCLVTYKLWNITFDRDQPPSETIFLATEVPTAFELEPKSSDGSEEGNGNSSGSDGDPSPNVSLNRPIWSVHHSTEITKDKSNVFGEGHLGLQKRISNPAPLTTFA